MNGLRPGIAIIRRDSDGGGRNGVYGVKITVQQSDALTVLEVNSGINLHKKSLISVRYPGLL
jgi:hypothetical protein